MSNANDYGMGCFVDGVPTNCNRLLQSINRGLGHALHVSGPGGSRATLMRLGIIVTEGPLHNDTRLWGVWALTPGGQRAVEPNPQDNRRLTVDETSALRNRIADLLTDPKCLPFINELLGKVAEQNEDNPPFSTDPLKLFDEIDRRAGYNYSTAQKINTVNSNLGYPNAAVLLLPPSTFGTGRWPGRMEYIASAIAKAAFHETFHLAGRNRQYSDQALARAMLDIAAAHGWNLPTEADKQKILSDKFSASFYWDGVLRLKCRPSSQRR
jgi:hypothetical protein